MTSADFTGFGHSIRALFCSTGVSKHCCHICQHRWLIAKSCSSGILVLQHTVVFVTIIVDAPLSGKLRCDCPGFHSVCP